MLHCIFFNQAYQLSTEPRQCQRWQEEGSFQLPIQDPFFSAGDLGRTWIGLEAWIGSWRRALAAAPLFVLCATVPACLAQGQSHRLHSTDSAASSAIIAPPISNMINRTYNLRMFSTLDYPQEKKVKNGENELIFLRYNLSWRYFISATWKVETLFHFTQSRKPGTEEGFRDGKRAWNIICK